MIEEAFVRGFDDYFDKNYFIEPCQEKGFGIMFKINDSHEYYWKTLSPNKFYKDEEDKPLSENVKYVTYINNPHILYKIVGQRNSKLYPDLITELHTKILHRNNSETKNNIINMTKIQYQILQKNFK